jgi:YnbE-like lipoprotein
MTASILTKIGSGSRLASWVGRGLSAAAMPVLLAGCVQVSAPDKPIEINLNINIRQEVVVSLRDDARQLIQNNPGVF